MTISWQNKNVLISGGSEGIGKAVALEIARQGGNLFLLARNKEKLAAAQKDILERYPDIQCFVYAAHVENPKEIQNSVKDMLKKLDSIDGVICNAGFARPGYFHELAWEDFENSIRVNYLGALAIAYHAYPHLPQGGFVAFTSSVAGYMGIFGYSAYAPSKFALIGLAETLAQEFYAKKIQVSVLCPPDTATAGLEKENTQKPIETQALSDSAGVLDPQIVAQHFLKKLQKGKFLITVNFESWLFYRLHGIVPGIVKKVILSKILAVQKKKNNS